MQRMRSGRVWMITVSFSLAGLLAGCSGPPDDQPDLGSVSGTVTLDGEPLAEATISFQPQGSGRPSYAVTDSEGYYEMQYTGDAGGAKIGKHLVSISTYQEGDPGAPDPEGQETRPERVPARYNINAADNEEMTVEVTAGSNTIDFSLSSEGAEIVQPETETCE